MREYNLSRVTRDRRGGTNIEQFKTIAEAVAAGAKPEELNVSTFCQKSEIEECKAAIKGLTSHVPQIVKLARNDQPDGQWVVQYSANLTPGIEASEVEAFFRGTHPSQATVPAGS